jgi:hypothetical protein
VSKLTTSFVLGYHGCDRAFGEKVLNGETELSSSTDPWHWLGKGIYFWEADPRRALEWAELKQSRNAYHEPFVLGAVIDLGSCLDLLFRENLELVRDAYESFVAARQKSGLPIPKNKTARNDTSEDKVLRFLDCAVIDHLCARSEETGNGFDSVRGLFVEREELFPGSMISRKSHSQIAVRERSCIKGIFRPV